jgi:cysteine synthase
MNPFQRIKDNILIEMLKEIAKKNRIPPEKMLDKLVRDAYNRL